MKSNIREGYYNSYLNQFQSRDPFPGHNNLPQSQNGYSYANNNPINLTDPTGLCAEFGDDTCWSLYDQIIVLCPTCVSWRDRSTGQALWELNSARLQYFLADIRAGWRPNDPLTDSQWNLAKQEAIRFGLPKELVAATLAAEIVYDTDWINSVYDISTASVGAVADLAYIVRDRPLFNLCYDLLEGFHEYFGFAPILEDHGIGYGAAPGIANVHAGPAVRTEEYINQTYPGQGLLPDLGNENQEGVRLRTLLSDEGSIRYAAAYLRWWADKRKGVQSNHFTDLTDNDMIIIYTAFRCDVNACYGSELGFQLAQTPAPAGSPNDFAVFLQLYKNKP